MQIGNIDKISHSLLRSEAAQFLVGQLYDELAYPSTISFLLSFVRLRSESYYFDTMIHMNTQPPCWI